MISLEEYDTAVIKAGLEIPASRLHKKAIGLPSLVSLIHGKEQQKRDIVTYGNEIVARHMAEQAEILKSFDLSLLR